MRVGRHYHTTGAFSPEQCGAILASAKGRKWRPAQLYGTAEGRITDPMFWDCRRSRIMFPWFLQRLDELVRPLRESLRFAIRNAPAWWNRHGVGVGFNEHYDRISSDANPRVLSCVVMLSPRDAYDGGELVVAGSPVLMGQGDCVVFSALTLHSVEPIVRGVRDSAVRWYLSK